jgi:deoxyribodipyrimidine photo-lyase
MTKRAVVWFRQDLRLHDNEALAEALKRGADIVPVFVFDERLFNGRTPHFGFPRIGRFRARFLLESVADLRRAFQRLGLDLVVRFGKPEAEVFEIARQVGANWVFCNMERMDGDVRIQDELEQKLWSVGQELHFFRGKMLYYTQDLPFPVAHTPDVFTSFRKEVERAVPVRKPLPAPTALPPLPAGVDPGEMPTLEALGHAPFADDPRGALLFRGGETAALERLRHYLWDTNLAKTYKETRNGLLGADYSTKFSPWLALGCLSPKTVYHELRRFEHERGGNESTYWLFFELLWRDFFRLMGKKYGAKLFRQEGLLGKPVKNQHDDLEAFQAWAEGRTGVPFVDANMRELNATGFMSNRGRQNVASFLTKDLKVNWLLGAEYFESLLVDYDACSNYGNWNYVAGVGNDPRENRYFNILTQALRYDEHGHYVRHWLPELAGVPDEKIHRPDRITAGEAEAWGVQYPKALVDIAKWA